MLETFKVEGTFSPEALSHPDGIRVTHLETGLFVNVAIDAHFEVGEEYTQEREFAGLREAMSQLIVLVEARYKHLHWMGKHWVGA